MQQWNFHFWNISFQGSFSSEFTPLTGVMMCRCEVLALGHCKMKQERLQYKKRFVLQRVLNGSSSRSKVLVAGCHKAVQRNPSNTRQRGRNKKASPWDRNTNCALQRLYCAGVLASKHIALISLIFCGVKLQIEEHKYHFSCMWRHCPYSGLFIRIHYI